MTFADVLFKPHGQHRPSKEAVMLSLGSFFETHLEAFSERQAVPFVCAHNGVSIYGEYCLATPSRGCVIMAHGYGQNRYILLPQEHLFRAMGFTTVIFDQRGFGESREPFSSFGVFEARDVLGLIQWAKGMFGQATPIVLFGVSMGAATVLNAGALSKDMDYIIADSGFASLKSALNSLHEGLGLGKALGDLSIELDRYSEPLGFTVADNQPVGAVEVSSVPICILHGSSDTTVDVSHAGRLYRASSHPGSRMEVFEGKGHALCVTDMPRYTRVMCDFLRALMA